ncbi:hypothetical protein ABZX95_41165, partial [Streptomyces sp. NPDC004232]
MRALFITWAWGSHYYPLVPFGWALRAAGHEVLVASHPSFAPIITGSGLPALPVGDDIDVKARIAAEFGTWRPAHRRSADEVERLAMRWGALATESAVAMAVDSYHFAEQWQPDIVVYEPMAYLAPGLAGDLGVPAIRLLWATDFLASLLQRYQDTPLFRRLGVDGMRSLGDVTLDPCPPSLQVDQKDVVRRPMRYVPYNG